MRLEAFTRRLAEQENVRRITEGLGRSTVWSSLSVEARPLFVASAFLAQPRSILLVTSSYDKALAWTAKLGLYGVPKEAMRLLPSGLSALFEDAAPETVALSDRVGALRFLASDAPGIVIATPQAVLERTLHPDDLRDMALELKVGDETDVMVAAGKLRDLGYEVSEPVRVPGQFSRRGGILDVFPMGAERPVRVEFFGDEVESIREFDPMSQRSLHQLDHLDLGVSRETVLPYEGSGIPEMVAESLTREKSKLGAEEGELLEELVGDDLQGLEGRVFFDRLDLYRPLIQPDGPCALDYLEQDGLLVLDEALELEAIADRHEEELGQALEGRHTRGEILQVYAHDFVTTAQNLTYAPQLLCLTAMNAVPDWIDTDQEVEFGASALQMYKGQPQALTQAIKGWQSSELTIVLGTDQPLRAKSVLAAVEVFPEPLESHWGHDESTLPPGLVMLEGNPAGGFVCPELGVALISDQELFGVGRLKLPQRKFSEGSPIATVLDLKPGDHVVHINFGIGVYQGLIKRSVDGIEKEYLHIEYKAPDRLFVPADQLDRIQKYMAPGDVDPKINRLTGGEWKKTVRRAREEAREFARELINVYAERKKATREVYGADTDYQTEMEGTFPWAETPSQLTAIEDVKRDLRRDWPMDRLVCGDVGFGKTEVAIRAAFKVTEAGKQVAILCPTTILSEQHYRSFKERLDAFPVKLGLLNRFVTGKERRELLEGLKSGEIDMVIGTHALLSNDLKFDDLGLLIIDEEQKFGVKHKESLKALRANIDVLSMSATPIPRTLSMALMNIRAMSLINDPPPGRLPVRTFVRPYGNEVVREAVLRELARGGQVYYVFNRVEGIYHVAERLRQLVPTAKIAVGHGQMHEKELEPVMVGFVKGEIDILVSTTIVESGLDIPNANTLIVDQADKFGLAQLYQLRGRVGRSDRQAYAYMLYEGSKTLTEHAQERLGALAEFSQLGSGYSLAFRDLQIRGAGDLLGAKQSGQMSAVGYDLYTQLIDSEVKYLKTFADGDRPGGLDDPLQGLEPLPSFDLPVKAYIPESYIEEEAQRLFYYKSIMTAREKSQLAEVQADMEDRYGHMPGPVLTALKIMSVRLRAVEAGVESVDGDRERLSARFVGDDVHPRLQLMVQRRRKEAYLSQDRLIWPYEGDPVEAAHELVKTLIDIEQEMDEQRAMLGTTRS